MYANYKKRLRHWETPGRSADCDRTTLETSTDYVTPGTGTTHKRGTQVVRFSRRGERWPAGRAISKVLQVHAGAEERRDGQAGARAVCLTVEWEATRVRV